MNHLPATLAEDLKPQKLGWEQARTHIHTSMHVVDAATCEMATDLVRKAREAHKALDDQRTTITGPLLEAKRAADDLFRGPLRALEEIQSILRARIGTYATAQKALAEAAMARSAETLAAGAIPTEIIPSPVEVAGLSVRETWDYEIVDATLVPGYLCSPDHVKIRRVLDRSGDIVGTIPGLRIYRKGAVTVR